MCFSWTEGFKYFWSDAKECDYNVHFICVCVFVCVCVCWVTSNSLWPIDFSTWGSSVHGDSPGQNTGVSCHALLQVIFPTQGSNPGLPHCRQILYWLSHQGKPKDTGVGSLSVLQGIFLTQESNWGLLHCRKILNQLSYQKWKSLSRQTLCDTMNYTVHEIL